jgi:hypothetical protein
VQRNGKATKDFRIEREKYASVRYPENRVARLVLPSTANPSAFDSVTIGQRLYLEKGAIYEASARVKWMNPNNGNIVITKNNVT